MFRCVICRAERPTAEGTALPSGSWVCLDHLAPRCPECGGVGVGGCCGGDDPGQVAAVSGPPWCWCCARYGLSVPATEKSSGIGERASVENDICGPCSRRSTSACDRVHVQQALKAGASRV